MGKEQGEVIQYIDRLAWGIAETGKTVYLGTEEEIRNLLVSARKHLKNPVTAQIITLERLFVEKANKETKKEQVKEEHERKERRKRAKELGIPLGRKRRINKKRG